MGRKGINAENAQGKKRRKENGRRKERHV